MTLQDLKDKIWSFLTKGPLFYLTAPIIIIAIVVIFIANIWDGGSKIAFILKDGMSEKTTYLSKHELEVLNEWVALIDYSDTYAQAIDRSGQFKIAYKKLQQGVWDNNILYVRDPSNKDRWCIIVDIWPGSSSCSKIKQEIEKLQDKAEKSRELQDTLGMWLYNSRPLEFNLVEFQKTYGRVTNLPDNMSLHQRNKIGVC